MLIKKFEIDKNEYGLPSSQTRFFACLVNVDASHSIASIIREINDNSWIEKLNIIEKTSYEARLKETVKTIMDDCLTFDATIKQDIYDYSTVGEYIVSKEGRSALIQEYNHTAIPLAELWKEKASKNPGFDYHSESVSNLIIFGEAKYNSNYNPYSDAIIQVEGFITKQKDHMELTDLQNFVSKDAVNNFLQSKKGFSIAFSVKGEDPLTIVTNAIKSTKINKIANYNEFYIIGVVINDK